MIAAAFVLLLAAQAAPEPAEPAPDFATLVEEEDDLLAFTYGWPKAAAAIPEVEKRMRADMAVSRTKARGYAREDKAERPATAPFNAHYFAKTWSTHGDTPQLLSLSASVETFTGGAHGNAAFEGLIWDKAANRAVTTADLFDDAKAALALLGGPYCAALDAKRSIRREDPLPLEGDASENACPPLVDQVAVPVDEDRDGRFEKLLVLIPPYVAGPYVEGSYDAQVPITPELKALVKERYRESF